MLTTKNREGRTDLPPRKLEQKLRHFRPPGGAGGRMRRSRFTEEQIVGILKAHQAGRRRPSCCTSMGSHARRSTAGTGRGV
jgi:hypothetical protein